jgi:hypothetical protein
MSLRAKKARSFQKALKKYFKFCLGVCLGLGAAVWLIFHYAHAQRFFERFTVVPVDTMEIDHHYNFLSQYQRPGSELMLDPVGNESDDLKVVLERLKDFMGLSHVSVRLAYHDAATPPGYIRSNGDERTIFLSTHVQNRREQISVLIHELCHIYVWSLKEPAFRVLDQEKLVDISGIFLGFGVLILNGMTDDFKVTLDGGYATEKKTFGYLKPEQFGYLLARFCVERGIAAETVKLYLNSAGWKFFMMGNTYLKKKAQGSNMPSWVFAARSMIRGFWTVFRERLSSIGIYLPQIPEETVVIY